VASESGTDEPGDASARGAAEPAPLSLFDFGDPPPPADELPVPPAPPPLDEPMADEPMADEAPVGNLLDGIVGQPAAVDRLQAALGSPLPAYLFAGPAGAGLRGAACRFAGELLAARSATPERERRLALAEQHPDLLVFDRVGAAMTAEQARAAVRAAAAAPVAGNQKVIVLCDVDRAALSAPILLKSVEEPPPSAVFVLLAEEVNRSMETLASRCARVDFEALSDADLQALLIAEGIDHGRAAFAAAAAGGSIDRARLLASDDDAAVRIETWRRLRSSLNGTAAAAMAATDAALEAAEQAAAPLEARHEAERAAADEQAELYGTNAGRSSLDERHRRELRRVRIDEITMGLAVLAAQIRDEASNDGLRAEAAAAQLDAIGDAAEALRFNANQRLALSCLFIRLGHSGQ
jgi:DNA polymerase-3 subunit delta'